MDIYTALKNDHDKVRALMNDLVNVSAEDHQRRHELIEMIRDELVPHSRAEEAVFYNSMRLLDATQKIAMHGFQEHMEAEALLRQLQVQDKIDMGWRATAVHLQQSLEQHIAEEEGEMFSAAQALFTQEEAVVMADIFERMKPGIKEEGLIGTTLEMMKNLMPPRLSMALDDITTRK